MPSVAEVLKELSDEGTKIRAKNNGIEYLAEYHAILVAKLVPLISQADMQMIVTHVTALADAANNESPVLLLQGIKKIIDQYSIAVEHQARLLIAIFLKAGKTFDIENNLSKKMTLLAGDNKEAQQSEINLLNVLMGAMRELDGVSHLLSISVKLNAEIAENTKKRAEQRKKYLAIQTTQLPTQSWGAWGLSYFYTPPTSFTEKLLTDARKVDFTCNDDKQEFINTHFPDGLNGCQIEAAFNFIRALQAEDKLNSEEFIAELALLEETDAQQIQADITYIQKLLNIFREKLNAIDLKLSTASQDRITIISDTIEENQRKIGIKDLAARLEACLQKPVDKIQALYDNNINEYGTYFEKFDLMVTQHAAFLVLINQEGLQSLEQVVQLTKAFKDTQRKIDQQKSVIAYLKIQWEQAADLTTKAAITQLFPDATPAMLKLDELDSPNEKLNEIIQNAKNSHGETLKKVKVKDAEQQKQALLVEIKDLCCSPTTINAFTALSPNNVDKNNYGQFLKGIEWSVEEGEEEQLKNKTLEELKVFHKFLVVNNQQYANVLAAKTLQEESFNQAGTGPDNNSHEILVNTPTSSAIVAPPKPSTPGEDFKIAINIQEKKLKEENLEIKKLIEDVAQELSNNWKDKRKDARVLTMVSFRTKELFEAYVDDKIELTSACNDEAKKEIKMKFIDKTKNFEDQINKLFPMSKNKKIVVILLTLAGTLLGAVIGAGLGLVGGLVVGGIVGGGVGSVVPGLGNAIGGVAGGGLAAAVGMVKGAALGAHIAAAAMAVLVGAHAGTATGLITSKGLFSSNNPLKKSVKDLAGGVLKSFSVTGESKTETIKGRPTVKDPSINTASGDQVPVNSGFADPLFGPIRFS